MQVEICSTADSAGIYAAGHMAERIHASVARHGRATLALSGGRTPAVMMRTLAAAELPWDQVYIYQVDERVVGDNDARRNLKGINAAFSGSPIPPDNIFGMPVAGSPPDAGAVAYYRDLCRYAGTPPRLDIVHLGLGEDGHTASLVPGDSALTADGDVALTGVYAGLRRMTLTHNALNRARHRVWLVTGASKQPVVRLFLDRDPQIVASSLFHETDILVLDSDAAGG